MTATHSTAQHSTASYLEEADGVAEEALVGRGGEGHDGHAGELVPDGAERQVVGAEVCMHGVVSE